MRYLLLLMLFPQTLLCQDFLILKNQETIYLYNPVNKKYSSILNGFFYRLLSSEYKDGSICLYYRKGGLLQSTCVQIDTLEIVKSKSIPVQVTQEKIEHYSRTNKIYRFNNYKLIENWNVQLFDINDNKIWERLMRSVNFGIFPIYYDMYESPILSYDGNYILFIHNRNGRKFSVEELNVSNTQIEVIMTGVLNPSYSESNRFILLEKPDPKHGRSNWFIYDRINKEIWEPLKNTTYSAMWLGVK